MHDVPCTSTKLINEQAITCSVQCSYFDNKLSIPRKAQYFPHLCKDNKRSMAFVERFPQQNNKLYVSSS